MSTGAVPTFVSSTNSPLAPPYMYSVMRICAFADAASIGSTSAQSQAADRFEIDVMTAPVNADAGREGPGVRAWESVHGSSACGRPCTAPEVFRARVTQGLQAV